MPFGGYYLIDCLGRRSAAECAIGARCGCGHGYGGMGYGLWVMGEATCRAKAQRESSSLSDNISPRGAAAGLQMLMIAL